MGTCTSKLPPPENIPNPKPDLKQKSNSAPNPPEYSISRAVELEEKEIVYSDKHLSPFKPLSPNKPSLINSPRHIVLEMTQKEAKQLKNIKTEFDNLQLKLKQKISVLSQHQLVTDDSQSTDDLDYFDNNSSHSQSQISHIIKTCKDILNYAQKQQQAIKEVESKKNDAEKKAVYFLEECGHWKESVTKAKQNTNKMKLQRDELCMKLDYYQQEIKSLQQRIIETEAQNLSNKQRIKDSETKMSLYKDIIDTLQSTDIHNINISEIESKLKKTYQGIHGSGNDNILDNIDTFQNNKHEKLRKAATTLYDLIAKNEEQKMKYETELGVVKEELTMIIESKLKLEQEMKDKMRTIQSKSKEKNLALQTLVKKNNKYLLESQTKIKMLTDERDKLSENCVYWHNLCQQQTRMLKGFQQRESDKTKSELDKYLRSQASPILSPDFE